ncbi:unnamed protein product [Pleuronectes platessa]|uniref:Uncharacterized protein n=1 Tax=Pleuronectes platessa TaxID=8262 RepID=A0A9N7VXS3_PLEPL|nr:unnamed protein product [Pleuronectes platessa]
MWLPPHLSITEPNPPLSNSSARSSQSVRKAPPPPSSPLKGTAVIKRWSSDEGHPGSERWPWSNKLELPDQQEPRGRRGHRVCTGKELHEPQSSSVPTHNGPYKWLQIKMAVLASVPQPTRINWVNQAGSYLQRQHVITAQEIKTRHSTEGLNWSNLMGPAQAAQWFGPSVPWGPAQGDYWRVTSQDNKTSLHVTDTQRHHTEGPCAPRKMSDYRGTN